jgi:hypothetical protein
MRAFAIVACVGCGIAALGLAFMTFMSLSLSGFPDSHVTDYEKAADGPLGVLAWAEVGFGLLFLALAFLPIGTRPRVIGCVVAVVVFVVVAFVAQIGIPWYFGTHLGLDNGIGG